MIAQNGGADVLPCCVSREREERGWLVTEIGEKVREFLFLFFLRGRNEINLDHRHSTFPISLLYLHSCYLIRGRSSEMVSFTARDPVFSVRRRTKSLTTNFAVSCDRGLR